MLVLLQLAQLPLEVLRHQSRLIQQVLELSPVVLVHFLRQEHYHLQEP
jgi:hypothetical protein